MNKLIQLQDEENNPMFPMPAVVCQTDVTLGNDSDLVPTATVFNKGTLQLQPGYYVVVIGVTWDENSAGTRQIGLALTSSSQLMDRTTWSRIQATDTLNTGQQITCVLNVTQATTYYINLRQNSGASLKALTRVSYWGLRK